MPVHDFKSERLFVDTPLSNGTEIACTREQHNYLLNVLRLKVGSEILVFNGRDGEWRARISSIEKRSCTLTLQDQTREQATGSQIDYLFAPLKRARLDYMVQKAVELGVGRLRPVITRHTIVDRVNKDRMKANVIEAAEQCGILSIPKVDDPQKLLVVLGDWSSDIPLIICDEEAPIANPTEVLCALQPGPLAVLIGPEGGFERAEREAVLKIPSVTRLSLGPRIMRADTAAIAALTLVNACVGDWR